VLFGREGECERLDGLLTDARVGRGTALVLRGDPGVGKTALLQYAIHQAREFDVLSVTGLESEAELPYSGLHALLRPIADLIPELPELQAHALRVALALDEGDPDAFIAAAGTLTLLAEAADRRPLLIAVDDAHWLDRASTDALLFTARRLDAERIAIVFTVRESVGRFERHGLNERAVETLADDAALRLLWDRWGDQLSLPVAKRLVADTGGNPLALVELTQLLTEEERLGITPLAEPLRVSDGIERSVQRKLAAFPDSTRTAVLLAAVEDVTSELVDPEAFNPAERAGLVRVHSGRVVFVHPLFRSAVYQSATEDERLAAHRQLAELLSRPGDDDLRAWHLAAAATRTDDIAAQALEAAADRAESRGGVAARARALERAAELSTNTHDRTRRLVAAADAARVAGRTQRAQELVESVLPSIADPLLHSDLIFELWAVSMWRDAPPPIEHLEREAEQVAPLDPERAARLLGTAIGLYGERRIDVAEMARVSRQLEPLIPQLGDWWRGRCIGFLAQTCVLRGEADEARRLFAQIADDPLALNTQVPALLWLELYDDARRALNASLELGRSTGQALRVAWTQACFGLLESAVGRYPQAIAAASEGLSVADEIEAFSVSETALIPLAEVAAEQGRSDDGKRAAARLQELGVELEDENSWLWSQHLFGKVALLEGKYGEAVELLRPVADRTVEVGVREPSWIPYGPELIEAYIRFGKLEDARQELDQFAAQAAATDRRWALAAAARCEALLASDEGFDDAFAEALARHEDLPSRVAEARTQLCYGERLRRVRRRRDAREQLRAALATFEAVGAGPWANRARAELEATGEKIARRDPTAPEKLTPQELQIALQVAEGRTNREVAAALFLSPKTVEHHLTHVYRKLELHSRAELIRLFATEAEIAAVAP
jgi:DNA-binding CsgD family transcriptional regulator